MMAIDNEVYNRLGETWWDENNPLNLLHGSMTPGRFSYFRDVLAQLGRDPAGLRALDIGCGGGFLAEEFARLGCQVVGIDPSPVSIRHRSRSTLHAGTQPRPASTSSIDSAQVSSFQSRMRASTLPTAATSWSTCPTSTA